MKLIVITGMSGAGKASAAKAFEDMDYTLVDNLPPVLLPELVQKCIGVGDQPPAQRLAVVIDARAGSFFLGWQPSFTMLAEMNVKPVVLFLDSTDAVLVQRFKETRRRHPLFNAELGILGSIRTERAMLEDLKECADLVIDTTEMDAPGLRASLLAQFADRTDPRHGLTITIASFGFKFGLPLDADLVFDVRFLINPHYVPALRGCDGRDERVDAYVMTDPDTEVFLTKLYDFIDFTLPQYIEEGKAYLTIAIGCTGGRHRSVMVAERLRTFLNDRGYHIILQHRDVEK